MNPIVEQVRFMNKVVGLDSLGRVRQTHAIGHGYFVLK